MTESSPSAKGQTHAPTLSSTLTLQFAYNHGALMANLDGIDHASSLRSPNDGGNGINWILGHILASRHRLLDALGAGPLLDEGAREVYRRGSGPLDPGSALPFAGLVAHLGASQGRILGALASAAPETYAAPAPFSPRGVDDETVGSLIAGLAFHEAYHVGQIGLLRRVLGLPGALR